MAIATLTLVDTDLETGAFRCDLRVADALIDDGKITAAHITGNYLSMIVPQDSFTDGVCAFGEKLITAMESGTPLPAATGPRTLVVTLIDRDLKTGRYSVELTGDGDAGVRPTAAQLAGFYMRSLLADIDFAQKVWAYAEELVANNAEASIQNSDQAPANSNVPDTDLDDADSVAA